MTTTQHTSGPWIVKGGNVIENESGVNIAKAWMTDREEECANARLIAAAPELLYSLKELVELNVARNMNRAKDAIAKAEGRTE